ncbi:hypothetical protein FQA39_LY08645 [Lamprigera yunnana]|nr:hypothetical protein FQA39_LY08645 [Lamprigera yunnana]
MSGFTCGYCKLQTPNTLPESWELISNHNCLNNNNLAIDENNMVYLDEDDGNNPLEEYNQRQPTINVLEEVSHNIETKSSDEWPNQAVLLLLDQYEVNKTVLSKKKYHVWMKISNEIRVHHHSYSWDQIQNKWKSLVLTYKSIKDHNSATGRKRKIWIFFKKIDYLIAKDLTVEPPTVVHNGHLQTTRVITEEAAPLDVDTPSSSGTITSEMGKSSNKNLKLQETVNEILEQNERHHQEEMKEKRIFNDLLEILINNLKI